MKLCILKQERRTQAATKPAWGQIQQAFSSGSVGKNTPLSRQACRDIRSFSVL